MKMCLHVCMCMSIDEKKLSRLCFLPFHSQLRLCGSASTYLLRGAKVCQWHVQLVLRHRNTTARVILLWVFCSRVAYAIKVLVLGIDSARTYRGAHNTKPAAALGFWIPFAVPMKYESFKSYSTAGSPELYKTSSRNNR